MFYPKCVSRLNLDLQSILCCKVFGNAASPDKSDKLLSFEISSFGGSEVVTFLKSNEFASFIWSVVDEQAAVKTTNTDLIKLLTDSKQLLSSHHPVPLSARSPAVVNKVNNSEPVSNGHLFTSPMECDNNKNVNINKPMSSESNGTVHKMQVHAEK